MSTQSTPIDPLRFAEALEALPLDALHAKAAELQNSIGHLRSSNDQMLPFADEGDQDCKEAMFENLGVIGRMNERVGLIKAEVEKRGMPWPSEEREGGGGVVGSSEAGEAIVAARAGDMVNGSGEMVNGTVGSAPANAGSRQQQSGRLTDEELRRRVEAQLEAQMAEDDDGDGVHL